MSAPILPKVAEWTRTKRNYRHAHLVLRLSLRVLGRDIQPFSERHWAVYEQMCFELGVIKDCYKLGVWYAAAVDKDYYVFLETEARWWCYANPRMARG